MYSIYIDHLHLVDVRGWVASHVGLGCLPSMILTWHSNIANTVETADRDSMLNRIVWANRIVHFRARLYHCGDPLYKIGR